MSIVLCRFVTMIACQLYTVYTPLRTLIKTPFFLAALPYSAMLNEAPHYILHLPPPLFVMFGGLQYYTIVFYSFSLACVFHVQLQSGLLKS